jgi:ABC-2 type transport system permease protein
MRSKPKPGFLLVARREWRWLLHDRAALILIFGVPLFAFAVLTVVFSHPVIRELGVVVRSTMLSPGDAATSSAKAREVSTLIFLGTSLPQLFVTGFSWPREAVPKSMQALGYIFPSDFAIDGIVRINQMGASLWEVVRDWRGLWGLTVIYFALAVMSAFLVRRRQVHG